MKWVIWLHSGQFGHCERHVTGAFRVAEIVASIMAQRYPEWRVVAIFQDA